MNRFLIVGLVSCFLFGLLGGCIQQEGRIEFDFNWPDGKRPLLSNYEPQMLLVLEKYESDSISAVEVSRQTKLLGPNLELSFGDIPNDTELRLRVEIYSETLSDSQVLYYGESNLFSLHPEEELRAVVKLIKVPNLNVRFEGDSEPAAGINAMDILDSQGESTTTLNQLANFYVHVGTDTGRLVRFSNSSELPDSLELLLEDDCESVENSFTYDGYKCQVTLPEPESCSNSGCDYFIHAQFEDKRGYKSPTQAIQIRFDNRAPQTINDVTGVFPAHAAMDEPLTLQVVANEPLLTDPIVRCTRDESDELLDIFELETKNGQTGFIFSSTVVAGISPLLNGRYTCVFDLVDQAGNAASRVVEDTFIIDAIPPSLASYTIETSNDVGAMGAANELHAKLGDTLSVSLVLEDDISTNDEINVASITLDAQPMSSVVTEDESKRFDYTISSDDIEAGRLSNGSKVIVVDAQDANGNSRSFSLEPRIFVDTIRPYLLSGNPNQLVYSSGDVFQYSLVYSEPCHAPKLNLHTPGGEIIELESEETAISSSYTYKLEQPINDSLAGTYAVSIAACTDLAGNISEELAEELPGFVIDATPPRISNFRVLGAINELNPSAPFVPTRLSPIEGKNQLHVEFDTDGEMLATMTLSIGGTLLEGCSAQDNFSSASPNYSCQINLGVDHFEANQESPITILVQAFDSGGNYGMASELVVLDSKAPSVVNSQTTYQPGTTNTLPTVSSLGTDVVAYNSLSFSEPIGNSVTSQGLGLDISLHCGASVASLVHEEGGGGETFFLYKLDASLHSLSDGLCDLHVSSTDLVGNSATIVLPGSLRVDQTPPDVSNFVDLAGLKHLRFPWGAQQTSNTPGHFLVATSFSESSDPALSFLESSVFNTGIELGASELPCSDDDQCPAGSYCRISPSTNYCSTIRMIRFYDNPVYGAYLGSLDFRNHNYNATGIRLEGADANELWISAVDTAGNQSLERRRVPRGEWVATTVDSSNYGFTNPHQLSVQSQISGLGRDPNSVPKTIEEIQGSITTSRSDAETYRSLDSVQYPTTKALESPSMVGTSGAYDSKRGKFVLFGGQVPGWEDTNDTWEWDGTRWELVCGDDTNCSAPPYRKNASLVYDVARERILMFGGYASATLFSDLWEWDGEVWKEVCGGDCVSPSGRDSAAMVYDSERGVVVLYGGTQSYFWDSDKNLSDTWEWDGTQWTAICTGSCAQLAPPFVRPTLVYNEFDNSLLLTGAPTGIQSACTSVFQPISAELWKWDSATQLWTELCTGTQDCGEAPVEIESAFYNRLEQKNYFVSSVDCGGLSQPRAGVWTFDSGNWDQLCTNYPWGHSSLPPCFDMSITQAMDVTFPIPGFYEESVDKKTFIYFDVAQNDLGLVALQGDPSPAHYRAAAWSDNHWRVLGGGYAVGSGGVESFDPLNYILEDYELAYSPSRKRVLLIGGKLVDSNPVQYNRWLLEWDGLTRAWIARDSVGHPQKLGKHKVAADGSGNIWVLGQDLDTAPSLTLWELSYEPLAAFPGASPEITGAWTWINRWESGGGGPPILENFTMAYEESELQLVVFGGEDENATLSGSTWVWNPASSNWTEISQGPSARHYTAMTYDPINEHILLAGGATTATNYLSDAWIWKANSWQLQSGWGSNLWFDTAHLSSTYHPQSQKVLFYGGYLDNDGSDRDEFYEWTMAEGFWLYTEASGFELGREEEGFLDRSNYEAQIIYEEQKDELLLFGGYYVYPIGRRIWTLSNPALFWPAHLFEASIATLGAGPRQSASSLDIRWVAGGRGNSINGATLEVWKNGTWTTVGANSAPVASPELIEWSTAEPSTVKNLLESRDATTRFRIKPSHSRGSGSTSEVKTETIEVRIGYTLE